VAATPLPPEFEKGREATPDELRDLTKATHSAIETIERCIALHHVVELDYTDEAGKTSQIRTRPGYIRHNVANYLVLWGIRVGRENWEEYRLDRIHAARDTGEEFTPTW
jgi:predicted DNA-binding transcriptional regulator YafY